MTTAEPARLVLLCGLPGAGKTTLARELARRLGAVRLCGDEWMADLGVDLADEDFRDRLEQRFWRHTRELLPRGQAVILESGFWLRSDRDEKRLGARALGAGVELHHLDVDLDELWRRLRTRNQAAEPGTVPVTFGHLQRWAGFFEAPEAAELALFDPPRTGAAAADVRP